MVSSIDFPGINRWIVGLIPIKVVTRESRKSVLFFLVTIVQSSKGLNWTTLRL